ncbi:MAG: carboxypeptidase-like regulatory domain-containing protein [Pyrinomonadaceae bacterium]
MVAPTPYFIKVSALLAVFLGVLVQVSAQSQALNGQIEGAVLDQSGAAVQSAVITAAHIETGASRTTLTDKNGSYRFPLLPLGTYRIAVEATSFRKLIRTGINLATGQAVNIECDLKSARSLRR